MKKKKNLGSRLYQDRSVLSSAFMRSHHALHAGGYRKHTEWETIHGEYWSYTFPYILLWKMWKFVEALDSCHSFPMHSWIRRCVRALYRHLCMVMRGVEKLLSKTVTSSMFGEFRQNPKSRAEFMSLINRDWDVRLYSVHYGRNCSLSSNYHAE